jgi:hypothetical protein
MNNENKETKTIRTRIFKIDMYKILAICERRKGEKKRNTFLLGSSFDVSVLKPRYSKHFRFLSWEKS